MLINIFEIEDENGQLVQTFDSVSAVEQFFRGMSQKKADRYSVLGIDEQGYFIRMWFAADVEFGNFARDLEDYAKTNKKPVQKTRTRERNPGPSRKAPKLR